MRIAIIPIIIVATAGTALAEPAPLKLKLPARTEQRLIFVQPPAASSRINPPQVMAPLRSFGDAPSAAAELPHARPFFGNRPSSGRPYFGQPIVGASPTEATSPQIPLRGKEERR